MLDAEAKHTEHPSTVHIMKARSLSIAESDTWCWDYSNQLNGLYDIENRDASTQTQILDEKKADIKSAFFNLVRKERLELSRREALEPKSSVSTNSTTPARNGEHYR